MSTQVGTSRAGRQTIKDKYAKPAVAIASHTHSPSQNKAEKSVAKNQATAEQLQMAHVFDSGKDTANIATVRQLCEMTGRSEEDVVVALHDAEDDANRAATILLEGEQGEWEVQDKKKKRSTVKSDKEVVPEAPAQANDKGDTRSEKTRDQYDYDRSEAPPRRGRDRRNGGPPPRLANRGRGRERNNYRGERDRDRSGFNDRGGFGDRINCNDRTSFNGEDDWDAEGNVSDFREHRRNDRDRGFYGERSRGRGRGGGGFGRPGSRGGRPKRFERQHESSDGPHIDTWTNETAENAEKKNSLWSEAWGESSEDLVEDQWTGSLGDTKVFTPSQSKTLGESDLPTLNETTSTLGQRLDVESLFSKSAGFAKAPDFTKNSETTSGDSFFSSYNQQAAESIKNSIGIGSSSVRQNISNIPASQPQSLGQLPAMPQRDLNQTSRSSVSSLLPSSTSVVPPTMLAPTTSAPLPSQQAQPQRRPQRSKLPPPSKIPSSAVEMPGHMMPQLDVQFGVDFGSDSNQFSFVSTAGDANASYTSSSPPTSSSLGNHLGQSNKTQADSIRQTNIMSSPSAGTKATQNSMTSLDSSPSRPSVFPSSVYTTPTKSESPASKVAEPIPYQPPISDPKTNGLMNAQRTTQSPSALSQGSLSASKPDPSSLPNFSSANGFTSNAYPSHSAHSQSLKSVSSASQSYSQTAAVSQTSSATFPNQYSSQTQFSGSQQTQYPTTGQSQFPGNQGQFPAAGSAGTSAPVPPPNQFLSGQAQFQSGNQGSFPSAPVVTQNQFPASGTQYHGNYQSSTASFQSQPSTQAAQNSLYPSTTQQSSGPYPSGSGSFHVRDSQSVSSLQQSTASQPSNTYQAPQPATVLNKATTTQSATSYNTQTFSAQHGQNLQTSPLGNKLGDSLSKISLKDTASLDTRTSQFDHSSSSATTVSLTSTTNNTSTISTSTSTVSATSTPVITSSTLSSRVSTSIPVTTKAPPNLPPGVPLVNPHLFMGQPAAGGLPPYFAGLQGIQQPIYSYEELQMMQQRLPLQTGNYYDITAYSGVPSTIATGRDQAAALATAPFTGNGPFLLAHGGSQASVCPVVMAGAAADNKQMNRVEAQSPSQSNQQQSTHSAPQQTLPFNIHYGYYYPGAMLPGTASFQYPTMFPMPPVTNAAAHVPGTTTAAQLPKTYGSHQGFPSKEIGWQQLIENGGYEEVSGGQDLSKVAYAGVQQQAKVAAAAAVASRTGNTADMNTGAYTKSHTQGFDKQGFPGGTPPPFNLPLANASQAGPLGAPTAPYAAPFLPMMPPQPHNQTILHHQLQQDSGTGSGRGLQQPASQGKSAAAKPYGGGNWGY